MIIDLAAIANDSERPRIKLLHMLIIASRNRIDRRGKVVNNGALQVLRLETFASPTAGGGAVIPKGATHAIVVTGAGKQSVDFLGGACAPPSRSSSTRCTADGRLCLFEQLFDSLAIKCLHRAALTLQPLSQPGDLVDSGDGASGELGKLGVDFGCRGLCNPACSFGERPIDMEAALVDPAAEHPQRLFRGR